MRGVDVDVCLDVRARDKRMTELELKDTIGEIDANIDERKDVSDVSAILVEDDLDPYVKMYKLLHHTQAQPWDLSGYVTVRAGTAKHSIKPRSESRRGWREKTNYAGIAKHRALEDDCDKVRGTLERHPLT